MNRVYHLSGYAAQESDCRESPPAPKTPQKARFDERSMRRCRWCGVVKAYPVQFTIVRTDGNGGKTYVNRYACEACSRAKAEFAREALEDATGTEGGGG